MLNSDIYYLLIYLEWQIKSRLTHIMISAQAAANLPAGHFIAHAFKGQRLIGRLAFI
jgi:hypothetical protein